MQNQCPPHSIPNGLKSCRKAAAKYSVIPTAEVHLSADTKLWHQARAILDTGSESNLISSVCAQRSGLRIFPMNSRIAGVGGSTSTQVLGCTCALIHQKYGRPHLLIPFFVVNKVTLDLPSVTLPRTRWPHLKNLDLADPNFHIPHRVDIIFSGDVLNSVLINRTEPSIRGSPVATLSSFGWLISGGYSIKSSNQVLFSPHIAVKTFEPLPQPELASSSSTLRDMPSARSHCPRPQRSEWHGLRQPRKRSDTKTSLHHSPDIGSFPFSSSFYSTLSTTLKLAPSSERIPSSNSTPAPEYAKLLDKMFCIESVEECDPRTPDELLAEELFRKSVSRLTDGRFQVALPFKNNPSALGHSKTTALKRLKSLERRLSKCPENRLAYNKFMKDYLDSGHMEPALPLTPGQPHYYIPHHSVHRPDDPPEKIRVVFNASQETMSRCSLNDLLLPGPRLQLDITAVVTRFRQDKWVFVSDIRQMFRQIIHPPPDRDFLRILWRFNEDEPVQEYRLCTVTYGTTSAPFLAGRVLRELADLNSTSHPRVAEILRSRTYVDDLNGGSDDLNTAVEIRMELEEVLLSAKLELRKWAANDPRLLSGIPSEHLLPQRTSIQLEDPEDASLKILGLSWQPQSDTFHYTLRPIEYISSKRQLASQIARIYDPLGWLMPVTVYARIIFRTVVQNHLDWDDVLPPSIISDWSRLAQELPVLASLHIPRYVPSITQVQWLVGFADASERAYGAVLYLVSGSEGNITVSLVIAKARMAPIKVVTLPRLELCAAQLLARMICKTLPTLKNVSTDRVVALSDSQIALSWITAQQAPLWKVFVGNRVANVHELVPPQHWFHVPTKQNPADHASRGLPPKDLVECTQWWLGPNWLKLPPDEWPVRKVQPTLDDPTVLSEARTSFLSVSNVSALAHGASSLEERFSSYSRLQAIVGLCLRYIGLLKIHRSSQRRSELRLQYENLKALRRLPNAPSEQADEDQELIPPLTVEELSMAELILIRRSQAQALPAEIADAQLSRPKLKITRSLGLFLDSTGVLRVGGRLRNSQLPDCEKHPALLPSQHPLTRLLIEKSHRALLHAGPLSTLHHLRSKFWVVNGKNIVRRQLAQCVDCFTVRPRPFQPRMGQLPEDRTVIDAPFLISGVDYAGPFPVSIAGLRKNRVLECYLSIFVCFATKAVHIEVVTDLTTPGFLQAFHRFIARRGCPKTIWSDNGRNFLGAANELRRIRELLQNSELQRTVIQEAATKGTTWKFIPPSAPFFGGLWEAAVKQAKRLLKICLRNQVPTLETFTTVVTQVEAVLNSRPLTSLSSSPDDLKVLTPAHFLIFRPLTLPPTDPTLSASTSLKDRHRFTQHTVQTFWSRWKKEYLLEIQSRAKWDTDSRPALIGDVVLIIDDNAPPLHWTMGRIVDIYPGTDGVTRVADVRTPSGTLSRPVRKLCPFPDQVCGAGASTVGEDVQPSEATGRLNSNSAPSEAAGCP